MMKDGEEFIVLSGGITPKKMSVNSKAGFSIINYEGNGGGTTIPHGLNQAPDFVIVKGIDNSYNYSFGIKEHIVFPEVNFDKVDKIRGLDVTIVTSSKNKEGTLELLKEFNFPLYERKN